MPKHTLSTLTADVDRRFRAVHKRLDIIQPQVEEMHDFIVETRGFERGQAKVGKDGNINISSDAWGLIIKLVFIIGAVLGIKAFLP